MAFTVANNLRLESERPMGPPHTARREPWLANAWLNWELEGS